MKEESPQYLRRLNAALTLREVPDYPAAMAQLIEAEKEAPRDAQVHLLLGLTHRDLGNEGAAEESLRKALGFDPDWEPVREALAALYYARGRIDEVIKLLKLPIARGQGSPELWYLYTAALLRRLRVAWDQEEEVDIDGEPTFAPIRALADSSSGEESEIQGRLASVYQALAEHYLSVGAHERALQAIDGGLAVASHHPQLLRVRVNALVTTGRFDEALELITNMQRDGVTDLVIDEYTARLGVGETEQARSIAFSQDRYDVNRFADAIYILRDLELKEPAATAATHMFEQGTAYPSQLVWLLSVMAEGGEAARAENILRTILREMFGIGAEHQERVQVKYPWIEQLAQRFELEWRDKGELALVLEAALPYLLLWKGAYEEAATAYTSLVARPEIERYVVEWDVAVAACYKGKLMAPLPEPFEMQWMPLLIHANLATAYCLAGEIDKALETAQAAVLMKPEDSTYVTYAVLGCVHLAADNKDAARAAWKEGLEIAQSQPIEEARALLTQWLADLDDEDARE